MPCDASGPCLGGLSTLLTKAKYVHREGEGVALPAKVRKARDKVVQALSFVGVFVALCTCPLLYIPTRKIIATTRQKRHCS